jgi:hypothetical protein
MKKILYLFSATLLVLTSCSKDESTSEPETSVLVKKIIRTYTANDIVTNNFIYNGNKIVSEISDGDFVKNYTYTGDVITKIEERVNNSFQSSTDYTYIDGKVATSVLKQNYDGTTTYTYTYNSNGTVSYKRTRSNSRDNTGILTILNGNIVKNEVFYDGSASSIHNYQYDTKNNPFKNVLGFNLLLETDAEYFSPNNMTQDGETPPYNYIFKYNATDFPTEKRRSDDGYDSSNDFTQYFY